VEHLVGQPVGGIAGRVGIHEVFERLETESYAGKELNSGF